MAAYDNTRSAYANTTLAGRIGQVYTSIAGGLSTWNDARETRNALNKLTDRELCDIGLNRGDIDSVSNNR